MTRVVKKENPDSLQILIDCINSGNIAIAPCDTIYGIVGKAPDTEGAIRQIKGRAETKPFIVLYGTTAEVSALAARPIPDILLEQWPGPLTMVIPAGEGTVGVRVPDDPFLLNILESTGGIYSTSVNFAGEPSLWEISEIVSQFDGKLDLIVDAGDLPGNLPSTVIDISSTPYKILRHGAAELPREVLDLCAE